MSIVNISAYKFISLDDLPALRERLFACCEALALKGTILLAPEGINLFLAGSRAQIDGFMASLHDDFRFADIAPKESLSAEVPFGRLRVRIKREIITMRLPTIRPEGGRAPAVDAPTLQRWLDQGHDDDGRELVLLDTRNDYETDLGKFPQAIDYRIASFTEFPAAIATDRARYEGKTIVSYCTGGIRCEKAVLHMQDLGLQHVYQLEGGILKYLEQTDGTHWQGDCFVFDGRVAVDKALLPSPPLPAIDEREHAEEKADSKRVPVPLPRGERVGVRGHAEEGADSEPASMDFPASTRPSSQPSHPQGDSPRVARGGEGANATSAMLHEGGV
ncbi:sulfurtransferase [Rhodanobacter sp. FDAARGOS 1247]|uniref:sulfurtransferase n=1 Tax=Rhodanobacter sp. FDAARGOS 1247 TaxID=2778082 RepID=UPI0019501CA2|nr:sulfurtransferase [Rhodanobacter sp. FDAARGOS 1247]